MTSAPQKAFLFDIGNVLLTWTPEPLVRDMFDTPEAAALFRAEAMPDERILHMDRGASWAEILAEIAEDAPAHLPKAEEYYARWIETVRGPIDEIVDLRDQLRAAGYPVYALSNFGAETFDVARAKYPLMDRFDGLVVSAHVGRVKPEPEIYQIAIERFGLVPAETLFIDDLAKNIAAAEALGIRTHHFTDPARLLAQAEAEGWLS